MKTPNVAQLRLIVCAIGLQCLVPVHSWSAALSPSIFGPGVISGPNHEAAPAFTPDGKTLYFQRSSIRGGTILVSHLARGRWSKPQITKFSGTWSDIEPAMAPDGSFLVFISNRPSGPGGQPLQGFYNGSSQNGGNMWRVERRGAGWSEPVRLPETVNRSTTIFAPAVVADGSVYFMDTYGEKPRFRLYRSQFRGGTYEPAQPRLSPDLKTLYFSSERTVPISYPRSRDHAREDLERIQLWDNGQYNIWSVPVAALPQAPGS